MPKLKNVHMHIQVNFRFRTMFMSELFGSINKIYLLLHYIVNLRKNLEQRVIGKPDVNTYCLPGSVSVPTPTSASGSVSAPTPIPASGSVSVPTPTPTSPSAHTSFHTATVSC